MNTTQDYDDIINLPHPEPQAHARMPLTARAAQFMPFAALKNDDEEEYTTHATDETLDDANFIDQQDTT